MDLILEVLFWYLVLGLGWAVPCTIGLEKEYIKLVINADGREPNAWSIAGAYVFGFCLILALWPLMIYFGLRSIKGRD